MTVLQDVLTRSLLYAALAGVVLLVNLLPAFGPPTWAVLVLFTVNQHLHPVPVVLLGALAAGLGRWLLATATGRLRGRLDPKRVAGLAAAGKALAGHRGRTAAGLALFALSPLPSAQLFEAAGLMNLRLLPLTAAFFAGRLVSYGIYVSAANAASKSFGSLVSDALTSPLGVGLQLACILGVVLLARVDWAARLSGRSAAP